MAYTAGFSVNVGDPTKASDVSTLAANDDFLKNAIDTFIANDANNRVLTGTGSGTANGEANLTFDGSTLALTGAQIISSTLGVTGLITASGGVSGTTGTFSGDVAVNTSTLKVDTSNNRVGIKNAGPSYPLDIGYTAGINQVAWRGSSNEIGFLTYGSSTDAGAVQLSSGGAAKILFDAAGTSYVNTGSNFGIGTASPQVDFHVDNASTNGVARISTSHSSSYAQLQLVNQSGNYWYQTLVQTDNSYRLYNGSDRLIVDSDGHLGLGGTPTSNGTGSTVLNVNATTGGSTIHLTNNTTGTTNSDGALLVQSGSDLLFINRESGNLKLRTADTDRLTVTSAGRVGINTTDTLNAMLYVEQDSTSTAGGIQIGRSGGTASWAISNVSSNLRIGTDNTGDGTINIDAMTIDFNGLVGIGTTSPASGGTDTQNVHIHNSTSHATYFKLSNNATGATNADGFDMIMGTSSDAYVYNRENGPIIFGTNAVEKMRITSAGNLLVGGTSQNGSPNRAAVFSADKFGLSIIDTTAQAAGVGGALNLGGNYRSAGDAQAFARIEAVKENATDANYAYGMAFSVTPNGTSSFSTEAVRISSDGKVGINSNSPTSIFYVKNNAHTNYAIEVDASDGSNLFGVWETSAGHCEVVARNASGTAKVWLNTEGNSYLTGGNVGIGTSSPDHTLHVKNTADDAIVEVETSATNGNPAFRLKNDAQEWQWQLRGATSDSLVAWNVTAIASRFEIHPNGTTAFTTADINVLFNGTNSSRLLTDNNGVEIYTGGYIWAARQATSLYLSRSGAAGEIANFRYNAATAVGSISVTSSATAFNTSSDYRLKENLVPITGAVDRVNALQPRRFNFINSPDITVDGFLAHEVSPIVPEAITGEKDAVDEKGEPEYQGIDQSKLVPLLTAAIQELTARIEALEAA